MVRAKSSQVFQMTGMRRDTDPTHEPKMYRHGRVPLNRSQISKASAFGRPGGGVFPCTRALVFNNSFIHSFIHVIKRRDGPRAFAFYSHLRFPSPLLLATLLFFALRSRYGCPPGLNRQGWLKRAQCNGVVEKEKQRPGSRYL